MTRHEPVMVDEVLRWAGVRSGGRYIDATLGGGGHAAAILSASAPDGRLLGLDADPEAVHRARERLAPFGERVATARARFSRLAAVAEERGFAGADAVIMDLGVSSDQLEASERGFSFLNDGPLDMRMNPEEPLTAAGVVNTWPEAELAALIARWGEEPRAGRIARRIVERRRQAPIQRTAELAEIVAAAVGRRAGPRHPATRTFMALRMAVNRELEELAAALEGAIATVRPGGRVAVIAFHSLEDRQVKRTFREHEPRSEALPEGGARIRFRPPPVRVLTKRPLRPSPEETRANPRARSARLRAAERIETPCSTDSM